MIALLVAWTLSAPGWTQSMGANPCGDNNANHLAAWQHLLADLQSNAALSELQKVTAINDFFNRVCWISDTVHWAREDYWATPVEMLSSNGGDCEDFSIGKYFSLKAAGIPQTKLRITYTITPNSAQGHMVLFYYPLPGADPFVLDNIDKRLLRASNRADLTPVYSFNDTSLRLESAAESTRIYGNVTDLTLWTAVTERMAKDFPPAVNGAF
ncbi:sulfate adenylyltransferase [Exilibacterium tricleocarpae]|uniref:Sulfate adenylyltransferase n=1 Tax=Exilibacterium tricleocarpae TaxID=2591008 RepID=A0A545U9F4_9GAMM|nr:transglutaminase-like cysteine peptidase [Exilibacterium tricleocarpae]TQV86069.1 sulfate adenylyltransferase [Exilibacterium tricleocarpae]